jgi:large subunit ribosomal protein L5
MSTIAMTKDLQKSAFEAMKGTFGYTNIMQAPRLEKVIVSSGVGSVPDKKKRELIEDRLKKITGQAVTKTMVKKSIANFKTRTGDLAGFKTTLRAAQMHSFLDKLIHIVLPRTRDFRGIEASVVDDIGNASVGIKEHTVFPECAEEDLKDVFGFGVTIVTTAQSREEAEAFLRHLGLPLRKNAK